MCPRSLRESEAELGFESKKWGSRAEAITPGLCFRRPPLHRKQGQERFKLGSPRP